MLAKRTRRYKDRRSLRTLDPAAFLPPPEPAGVSVVAVEVDGAYALRWTFSSEIVAVPEVCQELEAVEAEGGGVVQGGTATQVAADTLLLSYDNQVDAPGMTWRILSPPPGLEFAGGELVVPQAGPIAEP